MRDSRVRPEILESRIPPSLRHAPARYDPKLFRAWGRNDCPTQTNYAQKTENHTHKKRRIQFTHSTSHSPFQPVHNNKLQKTQQDEKTHHQYYNSPTALNDLIRKIHDASRDADQMRIKAISAAQRITTSAITDAAQLREETQRQMEIRETHSRRDAETKRREAISLAREIRRCAEESARKIVEQAEREADLILTNAGSKAKGCATSVATAASPSLLSSGVTTSTASVFGAATMPRAESSAAPAVSTSFLFEGSTSAPEAARPSPLPSATLGFGGIPPTASAPLSLPGGATTERGPICTPPSLDSSSAGFSLGVQSKRGGTEGRRVRRARRPPR